MFLDRACSSLWFSVEVTRIAKVTCCTFDIISEWILLFTRKTLALRFTWRKKHIGQNTHGAVLNWRNNQTKVDLSAGETRDWTEHDKLGRNTTKEAYHASVRSNMPHPLRRSSTFPFWNITPNPFSSLSYTKILLLLELIIFATFWDTGCLQYLTLFAEGEVSIVE